MERVEYESLIIQDLLGYHDRNELDIAPWYQRRSVWTRPQKAYLINTIHESKPVPSLYIRHAVDFESEKSIKEVVDGQQRIRSVIEYRSDKFPARHPKHREPVYYSGLTRDERVRFLQASLSVGYMVGATDEDVIEIFARINTVSKTLNPQERRNANYSGSYKQFCLTESAKRLSFWRDNGIFTDAQISRMLEVQFVSDVVMNMVGGLQDFSEKKLSDYYKANDDVFPEEGNVEKRLDRIFSLLVEMPGGTLRGTIFSAPQLLFSLILVIDAIGRVTVKRIRECVVELDSMVEAMATGESPDALSTQIYGAFTPGNLHRIRSRRLRAEVIESYLH